MFQIFNFFSKNRILLLFLFLEFVAFILIFQTHSYQQSKYITSSHRLSGSLLKKSEQIHSYFGLKDKNKDLIQENVNLKNELEKYKQLQVAPTVVMRDTAKKYAYIVAKVIQNSYLKRDNTITLDKGLVDGVQPNMGVILPNGIVGITLHVSQHFSTVMTILNSKSSINVKFKKNHHFGSLQWNGVSYTKAQLWDIPVQADIKKGDTIVTGGHSVFFPEQIPVGVIEEVVFSNKTFDRIDVKLFADFSALHTVYIVTNKYRDEQQNLEAQTENE
jgi:rod shape-determining protein MreC